MLRMEDIDSPRIKPWTAGEAIDTLQWLGLDWDAGPDDSNQPIPLTQSRRLARYHEVFESLVDAGVVYRCYCTRSEIQRAASAPHEQANVLEGTRYPGTCRDLTDTGRREKHAWRWRLSDESMSWRDNLLGPQHANPLEQLGDFVIAKQDMTPAYQLAVVIDDHDFGVTEIVRGDDLIYSTYRQRAILNHLGWQVPSYYHVPLMVGTDGLRLAKRHGDTRVSALRKMGVTARAIVGYLAWTAGLLSEPTPCCARDLVDEFTWQAHDGPTVVDHEQVVALLKRHSK
ncbi:MAG: tRNA glutamyl-Q(34) synthetase GluQRS [Aureliella sp.]